MTLHGGHIRVHSDGPGTGSCFHLSLPQVPAPPAATPTPPADAPGQALRALVVEDHVDARETLLLLLELWGHQGIESDCGQRALDLAESGELDVALVDIQLPDMDGYTVARTLRERFGPTLPLIALSGFGQTEDRQRALAAGFNDHMTKPLDVALLRRTLAGPQPRARV